LIENLGQKVKDAGVAFVLRQRSGSACYECDGVREQANDAEYEAVETSPGQCGDYRTLAMVTVVNRFADFCRDDFPATTSECGTGLAFRRGLHEGAHQRVPISPTWRHAVLMRKQAHLKL
jgi:hypothetical protein